ncbi:glycoside hydrolase family 140 protein [Marinilongibacter aquaticus]|uniref:glycoside hydrolase family 140 protein n=1 Tax=Marinilongibacter aquaticus TaxID=2975157 RepID=UPI0021BD8432|nr:glycoside hydrolase family 140 protein [Marinilongibacter aquaticus]UBM58027.1 glycoside hydrolase family 140 protein [Marinilongibacter aquaticus]
MKIYLALACLLVPAWLKAQMPQIQVSENQRFLMTEDGKPFFWTADTAWELFHKLDEKEAETYFQKRASQGFNVIQAVALAELDGINTPNAKGEKPFRNLSKMKPNPQYFKYVMQLIEKAGEHGLYVALLPTWGDKLFKNSWGTGPEIFNTENAYEYGKWLGLWFRSTPNIIWVLGGDRNPREGSDDVEVWRAMAKGLKEGLGLFKTGVFTFHPQPHSPGGSSDWFQADEWLSFNMHQTGHCPDELSYPKIQHDYNLSSVKPVLDGEPLYEDHPICFKAKENGYSLPSQIRRIMYSNVMVGACGQTYGCHDVWQMYKAGETGVNGPLRPWEKALDLPMANQMKYLKNLMLSRPYFDRIPDQGLLDGEQVKDKQYVSASRDGAGTYAFIYFPQGQTKNVDTHALAAARLRVWWYDPRTGASFLKGELQNYGSFSAVPPSSGEGNDWVLVIDDAAKGYPAPGTVAY